MHGKNTLSRGIIKNRGTHAFIVALFLLASISCGCMSDDGDEASAPGNEQKNLRISGSTTIQPVSEILAAAYMNEHPGVDITVNGGGSSTGIKEAGTGLTDIGAASREVKETELVSYPDMKVHRIGASAIVIITSQNNNIDTITYEEACALYDDESMDISSMPGIADIDTVIQRSEESGTEETFAGWLFSGKKNVDTSLETVDYGANGDVRQFAAEGNSEVLNLVKDNPYSIGFVDFGYAESDPGVKILKIRDKGADEAVPSDINGIREAILRELTAGKQDRGEETFYVAALTRPLNYVTNGEASPMAEDFIDFAVSPSSKAYFNEIGYFSIAELNGEI